MNSFIFENSTRFYFGKGQLESALDRELANAKTVMIAYGGGSLKRTGLFDRIAGQLEAVGKHVVEFGGIMSNPTIDKVIEGGEVARAEGVDFILAVGGGSVMDASKVIALAAVEPLGIDEFWAKYYQRYEPVTAQALPLGIVVTATGTGSEGNGGSVITNPRTLVKTGMDRPQLNARFCVQDPELTYSVPASQKIAGGYDALNHMMEEYFSAPVGDIIADDLLEAAMRSVIRNLPRVVADDSDCQAHANLEWASSLAENRMLKCGKSTNFMCHMIEHQVGAYTDCVHGFGLAAITASYYRAIYDASAESLFQFGRFATNVWGIDAEGRAAEELALAGIDALDAWTREVGAYRSLSELGVKPEQIDEIAASVMILPGCFKQIGAEDIAEILRASM